LQTRTGVMRQLTFVIYARLGGRLGSGVRWFRVLLSAMNFH